VALSAGILLVAAKATVVWMLASALHRTLLAVWLARVVQSGHISSDRPVPIPFAIT
jgi:hypothetical protein